MNAPDRSGPSLDLLANSAENNTPQLPFNYCPANGFTALTPAVEYTPSIARSEFVVSGLSRRNQLDVLAVCVDRKIAITPASVFVFGNGWGTAQTVNLDVFSPEQLFALNEQAKYLWRLEATDKDTLLIKVYNYDSGDLLVNFTHTATDLFAGNPVFHLGYPADAQLVGLAAASAAGSTSVSLHAMQVEDPGPTAVSLSPSVTRTTAEVGYWVGNLWATHARTEALPCTFALVAGTGDTNNALFSIRGTNLHVAGTISAGNKSIRVRATDRYGATFAQALTVTVS